MRNLVKIIYIWIFVFFIILLVIIEKNILIYGVIILIGYGVVILEGLLIVFIFEVFII